MVLGFIGADVKATIINRKEEALETAANTEKIYF